MWMHTQPAVAPTEGDFPSCLSIPYRAPHLLAFEMDTASVLPEFTCTKSRSAWPAALIHAP